MSNINKLRYNLIALLYKSNFNNYIGVSNIYIRPCHISNYRKFSNVKEPTFIEEGSKNLDSNATKTSLEMEKSDVEKELLSKIETLSEEITVLKDKYQRTLADRENLRIRLENQIKESKLYGIQSFCKDLLEVSDVFRKAIESHPEEKIRSGDIHLKQLYDGIVMTENNLLSVFRRHGLEKIIPLEGEKFDPSFQEAMLEVPSDNKIPGTVSTIIRNGWKLHNRCIRSAQVGVVKYK